MTQMINVIIIINVKGHMQPMRLESQLSLTMTVAVRDRMPVTPVQPLVE